MINKYVLFIDFIFRKKIECEGRNGSVTVHDIHIQKVPGVDGDSLDQRTDKGKLAKDDDAFRSCF
jgi:hypothetical protein